MPNSIINFQDTLDAAASVDRELRRNIRYPLFSSAVNVVLTPLNRYAAVSAAGGLRTITLPSAVGLTGMRFGGKKTDLSANTVTVLTVLGQTIDGVATFVILNPNEVVEVVSDGANWLAIAGIGAPAVGSGSRGPFQFGRSGAVPGGGMLQLEGPGLTLQGFRLYRPGFLTAGSIETNGAEPALGNTYKLSIQVNAVEVAFVTLPVLVTGASSSAFVVAVVTGDIITAFVVRTAGAGASAFNDMQAAIEFTL